MNHLILFDTYGYIFYLRIDLHISYNQLLSWAIVYNNCYFFLICNIGVLWAFIDSNNLILGCFNFLYRSVFEVRLPDRLGTGLAFQLFNLYFGRWSGLAFVEWTFHLFHHSNWCSSLSGRWLLRIFSLLIEKFSSSLCLLLLGLTILFSLHHMNNCPLNSNFPPEQSDNAALLSSLAPESSLRSSSFLHNLLQGDHILTYTPYCAKQDTWK